MTSSTRSNGDERTWGIPLTAGISIERGTRRVDIETCHLPNTALRVLDEQYDLMNSIEYDMLGVENLPERAI